MTTAICTTASGATSFRANWKRLLHVFMSLLVLFMAAALLTGCKKGSANWKKGISAMEKGEYDDAVEAFEKSAKEGNTDARMMLAVCYAAGIGVDEQDIKEAEEQLRKAAKTDDPVAQAAYGICMYYRVTEKAGSRYDRDEDEVKDALKYIKKSADQDCVFGQLALAFIYLDERDEEMRVKGVKYLKKAAEHSLSSKKIFLDDAKNGLVKYALSKLVDVDDDEIVEGITDFLLFDKATVTNMCIIGSQAALYMIYSTGTIDGIDKNEDEAEKWLKKVKKNGLPKHFVAALKLSVAVIQKEEKERKERYERYERERYDEYGY